VSLTLGVRVESDRLERIGADLLVAPFFETDRPLRGAAAHVDWRSCGLLSEQILCERVRGGEGECVLLPSAGRMRARQLLALGLGPRPGFGEAELRRAAALAGRRASGLRVGSLVFALPSEGHCGIPADLAALCVTEGVVDALRRQPAPWSLALWVAGAAPRVEAALRAASGPRDGGIQLRLLAPSVASRPTRTPKGAPGAAPGGSQRPPLRLPTPR